MEENNHPPKLNCNLRLDLTNIFNFIPWALS